MFITLHCSYLQLFAAICSYVTHRLSIWLHLNYTPILRWESPHCWASGPRSSPPRCLFSANKAYQLYHITIRQTIGQTTRQTHNTYLQYILTLNIYLNINRCEGRWIQANEKGKDEWRQSKALPGTAFWRTSSFRLATRARLILKADQWRLFIFTESSRWSHDSPIFVFRVWAQVMHHCTIAPCAFPGLWSALLHAEDLEVVASKRFKTLNLSKVMRDYKLGEKIKENLRNSAEFRTRSSSSTWTSATPKAWNKSRSFSNGGGHHALVLIFLIYCIIFYYYLHWSFVVVNISSFWRYFKT